MQLEMLDIHRRDLTHELGKYLVDVEHEPNTGLLVNALKFLRRISTFWTQMEVESGHSSTWVRRPRMMQFPCN